jgi:hypothetical protein
LIRTLRACREVALIERFCPLGQKRSFYFPLQGELMKPTFKTSLIFLLILALSACQSAAPEPAAPPKTSPAQPTRFPTQTDAQPPATEASATEIIPVTEAPTLPAATEAITATTTTETMPMPILTQNNQDLTFGSGQMIVAFGEGFLPGEAVAISLIHADQGVVLNKSANADSLGYAMAVKRMAKEATNKDALPPGQYTYRLAGSAQTLEFRFRIEYNYQSEPVNKGCGYYPEKAVFNGYQAFWCAGLEPGKPYQLTSRIGEAVDQVVNTADPFGLVVYPLTQSSNTLSPGVWTVTLGLFTQANAQPVDIGFAPMTVEILPPK